ncbi:MAG: sigma 54-interacting transcriptional regulator [Deltaproteobacteria bacterium]|nr:sigma 54-interacting transcriptional regulator [Deltaproteobacteria bacterium]
MPYCIVAKLHGRALRFPLELGANSLGSEPDSNVLLTHPTIAPQHAVLNVSEAGITVEDLGSRNGILIRGHRVREAHLLPGDSFEIGRYLLEVELVALEDLEVGIALPPEPESLDREEKTPPRRRIEENALDRFSTKYLPRLLTHLYSGTDLPRLAQHVGFALSDTLPIAEMEVIHGQQEERGVLYSVRRDTEDNPPGPWIEAHKGDCTVRVLFADSDLAEFLEPLVESGATLLALAELRNRRRRVSRPRGTPTGRPQPASVNSKVQEIYDQGERVAASDVGVLICGESGTGKEVLAQFIHTSSSRSVKPLVAVNCASLPSDLLEAELFGVERGVATGVEARAGKFEAAHDGTLFLDEVGDMAPETQAKILRALQEKEVYRLGSHQPRPADARIIAATNQPIDKMLAEGSFRTDLYHRIATWVVELPALRHRRSDIPNLAAYFLAEQARLRGIRLRGISRAGVQVLQGYSWPGNIRQLRNEIARAVLFLEDGELLDSRRLSPGLRAGDPESDDLSLSVAMERAEHRELTNALRSCGNNAAEAAKRLQISRATLYRRMKALGIRPSSPK